MTSWSINFSSVAEIPSCLLSNFLWYNRKILIDKKPIYFYKLSKNNINFVHQLFLPTGKLKYWSDIETEFNLSKSLHFQVMQLLNAIPLEWKKVIEKNYVSQNLCLSSHHLIKNNNLNSIEKLSSQELYWMLIQSSYESPTSQVYFEKRFNFPNTYEWKKVYTLIRQVTLDSFQRAFQYKILNNVLYLNNKLFQFGLSDSPLCSFCKKKMKKLSNIFFLNAPSQMNSGKILMKFLEIVYAY